MIILFCGGQHFKNQNLMHQTFRALVQREAPFDQYPKQRDTILHSTAPGAGRLAGKVAIQYGLPVKLYRPDWRKHGKKAAAMRDQQMIENGKPDLVITFHGGKRTNALVQLAHERKVPVIYARRTNVSQ